MRPVPTSSGQAATLARTAELIRGELRRRGVDFVPLAELQAMSGIAEQTLRAGVDRSQDLGIGGPARWPVVWRVDVAPLAAGFRPVVDGERLKLQLAAAHPAHDPLVISGGHLDPGLQVELDIDVGVHPSAAPATGELGYAVVRLEVMAARWLAEGHELFSLISRVWKANPLPVWSSGRLRVHCADLGERVAIQFWRDHAPATQVELVLWADPEDGLVLVNVYPCTTEHSILKDPESTAT